MYELLLLSLFAAPSEPVPTSSATDIAPEEAAQTPDPTADRAPGPEVPSEVPAPEVVEPVAAPAAVRAEASTPVVAAPPSEPAKPANPAKDPTPIDKTQWVPGKGIEFSSKDGRFSLQLRARVQVRYDLDHPNVDGGNTVQNLQIRRARLQLQGNVFGKHIKYYLQFGFSPRDQIAGILGGDGDIRRTPLRDARLEFDRSPSFTIWAGQMKVPFSRQRVISSGNMNLVDRSLANDEFQLDRDIGVQLLSKDIAEKGWFAYNLGVFMGEGRNNFEPHDFGMLYVARFEARPFGKFDDYSEGDIDRSKKPGMSIGAAYAFHDEAPGDRGTIGAIPADGGTTDLHNVTGDIFFKWYGASLQTAFHWRKGRHRDNGGAVDDMDMPIPTVRARDGLGWFVQPGYLVPKIPLEIVARYGLVRRFGGSSLTWADELGGGLNWYFAGHNLKLQLDYFRLWGASTGDTPVHALAHGGDRIRLQVQMAF